MLTVERILTLPMAGVAAAAVAARSPTPPLTPLIEIAPPSPRARVSFADGRRFGASPSEARPTREEREERTLRHWLRGEEGGEEAAKASGFAAQRIAQEVLAGGLTFEPFAHAAAAYRAAARDGAGIASTVMFLA